MTPNVMTSSSDINVLAGNKTNNSIENLSVKTLKVNGISITTNGVIPQSAAAVVTVADLVALLISIGVLTA